MVQIENDFLSVKISETGGKLLSIWNKQTEMEYLLQKMPMPNLFPFVGRLFEQAYTFQGNPYHIKMHGFLQDMNLELEAQTESSCCLLLKDTPETRTCYPFEFAFRMQYSLEGQTLQIRFLVENHGDGPLYCGMGGHPGFSVPLEDGLTFEDYELTFSEECNPSLIEFSDSILCTGQRTPYPLLENKRLPLKRELFSLDAVVLADTPRKVTLSSPKGRHGVTVDCPDMPYRGFWRQNRGQPPFLCIEPWSVLPGRQDIMEDLSQMQDMTEVPAGAQRENCWSITVW